MDGGLRHSAECRRAGMSCFDARCRTRGASLGGRVCRGRQVKCAAGVGGERRSDNDRGMFPNPRLDGRRAAGEMRRGRRRGW